METAQLGCLTVSRLGYGCYAFGGAYGRRDPDVWSRALRLAMELGVNYFDTAESYGPAEEILGRELGAQRDQIVLATKVGLGPLGKPDLSAARVVAACEGSLRRLGTAWIDLYQVHFDDPHTPVAETVGALESLKKSGKIREYGVGHLPSGRVGEYLDLGRPAMVLCELSPVATAALRSSLPLARRHGVPAVAFSPTGRGLLSGSIRPGHRFADGDIRRLDPLFSPDRLAAGLQIHGVMAEVGRSLGRTAVQVAIAWVLAQNGVVAALTGAGHPEHLRENAGAIGWGLPEEALQSIEGVMKEEEGRLAAAAIQTCRAILAQPLSQDGGRGFGQLMLVIDTAVEHGWAQERDMVPLVMRLLQISRREQGKYHPELEEIRLEVAKLVPLSGNGPHV